MSVFNPSTLNSDGIRPYGPGKFSTLLDAYVYDVSLFACDDETGSSEDGGWYGLMLDGSAILDADPASAKLNETERAQLTHSAGVILYADSQGFVTVTYYSSVTEITLEWAHIMETQPVDEDE